MTSPDLNHAQTAVQEGLALHQKGQLAAAQAKYEQALRLAPRHFEALHLLGVVALQTKNFAPAAELIGQAIAINPQSAPAHNNQGLALEGAKQPEAALASFERAIALKADYAEAYNNHGNALRSLGQYQAALESYEAALRLKPDYAEAHYNRGNVLRDLNQHSPALESYSSAIRLRPNFADAYNNRGNALRHLKQHRAAIADYDAAIGLKSDYADAYYNRGNSLRELKQYQAAADSYDKTIQLRPDFADAYNNRGNALLQLKQLPAAIDSFDKALQLDPNFPFLQGTRLHAKMQACDWRNFDADVASLTAAVERGAKATPLFSLLALINAPSLQRIAAETWVQHHHPANPDFVAVPKRARHGKIRIGYFSTDFCEHAVAFLTAELFEIHDRSQFEIYAFSFGPDTKDQMRKRLEAAFDRFIDVREKSDADIVELARALEIDIAVDLTGHTIGARTEIFAQRAAPIQVNYLGYPGTMGADFIDYIIADSVAVPEDQKTTYVEKIVHLPACFQVNDSKRRIASKPTRQQFGLTDTQFVLCSFNNSYKFTPAIFKIWLNILRAVDNSVLWLVEANPWQTVNLRTFAADHGIAPERLIFTTNLPYADHLARYQIADVALDTLPFNGGTTTSDTLWAGLPVVTCRGDSFAGRMAASLLTAVGLPELITTTAADYEARAIELAKNPALLNSIKTKLRQNRLTSPLFHTALFARHIEAAYTQMYERYVADLPPDHITVA